MTTHSGIGFDVHPLIKNRQLILGGILIPFEKGLHGHSDGDVLIHAIIDAILGGSGLGDIGTHFPSNNATLKGISSIKLLEKTLLILKDNGWKTTYVDATILAENPILSPFTKKISSNLATSLNLDIQQINIKAKSTNGLGFIGRGEGISALAIATLDQIK